MSDQSRPLLERVRQRVNAVAACRTFGELAAAKPRRVSGLCRFCHTHRDSTFRYSTRHSICDECVEARKDVVLPKVKRREKQ